MATPRKPTTRIERRRINAVARRAEAMAAVLRTVDTPEARAAVAAYRTGCDVPIAPPKPPKPGSRFRALEARCWRYGNALVYLRTMGAASASVPGATIAKIAREALETRK